MTRTRSAGDDKCCACCEAVKPRSSFYRDKHTADGLNPYCIVCARSKSRRSHYERSEASKERKLARERAAEGRAINRKATTAWRLNHPQKKWAHHTMNNAIRDGRFKREPCEKCGNPKSQGHHHDYSKPFDVHWLCQQCHGKEHRRTPEAIAATERGV